jgi:hypothetical protein
MHRMHGRLLLAAGAIVTVGSLLPWHIVHGGGHSLNIDGIDSPNNGLVTLALGLGLVWLAWRMAEKGGEPRRAVLGLTIVTMAATVWALLDASNADDDFNAPLTLERTYGQWVLLAGAVLALVVGILMNRPQSSGGEPPSS